MSPRAARTRRPPPGERALAWRSLVRVADGAYADRAFAGEARSAGITGVARGAAMRLAYGTIQRQRTLDWVLDGLIDRPDQVEPPVRDLMRLGAFELLYSRSPAEHAIVDETVSMIRSVPGSAGRRSGRAGLANAVLRRVAADGPGRLAELAGDDRARAGIRHSLPEWIVDVLWEALGAEAEGAMAAMNTPAESALRWNPLRGPRATLERELPAGWRRDLHLAEAYVLAGGFALEDSAAWERGRAVGQSRASMLPARLLAPRPGERVLDLCSAPGAKTTHLAALAHGGARIICVELHPARARALTRLAARLGAVLADVRVGDATEIDLGAGYDAVLLDPPCSGLGTLSARPDARWRRRPEAVAPLADLQRRLLERALGAVRPGGRVVYSTCTLNRAENEDVLAAVGATPVAGPDLWPEAAHPELPGALRTLPHRHGTDGFFVARLAV